MRKNIETEQQYLDALKEIQSSFDRVTELVEFSKQFYLAEDFDNYMEFHQLLGYWLTGEQGQEYRNQNIAFEKQYPEILAKYRLWLKDNFEIPEEVLEREYSD